MGLARSSAYYRSKPDAKRLRQEGLIEEVSRENPVYGYRKVTALLRKSGESHERQTGSEDQAAERSPGVPSAREAASRECEKLKTSELHPTPRSVEL